MNSEKQQILNSLPPVLFIIGQFFYDWLAPEKSTNWSIFYFTLSHLGFLILTIHNIIYYKRYYKLFNIGLAFGFILYIGRQLSKIGMDYDKFMQSVNNYEQDILISVLISIVTIIIFIKLCLKHSEKN